MKTPKIQFRMHAWSDAAGKYNPEAVRDGNEDNFYVDDDLSNEQTGHCESDVVKLMGELGLIMAVADGMGGMNAGEVASEIAVQTIQDYFSPGRVQADVARSHAKRKKYLEDLIVEADRRIKAQAHANPEQEGMGSTIILAWIVGNQLTLSWCGDSRAYRFNPQTGIELISEDHSYVQELVKEGVLTYEQTFEHPQGNIVTRSLGDESKKSQPETRFYQLYDHDIILLCSDGLSGVLRDRKTLDGEGGYYPGDNLEDIIQANCETLSGCRQALWAAAEQADWYDNVTAVFCEIISGAGVAPLQDGSSADGRKGGAFWNRTVVSLSPKKLLLAFLVILMLALCVFFVWKNGHEIFTPSEADVPVVQSNSTDLDTVPPTDDETPSEINEEIKPRENKKQNKEESSAKKVENQNLNEKIQSMKINDLVLPSDNSKQHAEEPQSLTEVTEGTPEIKPETKPEEAPAKTDFLKKSPQDTLKSNKK